MAFIKVNLSDVKEPEAAPEGEYELRVAKAVDGESKKGNPMTTVTILVEGSGLNPPPAPFQHFIVYPGEGDQYREMRLLDIKRFLTMFGVDFSGSGFDSQDLVGATAKGFLQQEEGDDGVIRNRLRLTRLRG